MLRGRVGRPGLLGVAARTAVVAGTAQAVTGSMHRRQLDADEQQSEAQASERQQQVAMNQAAAQGCRRGTVRLFRIRTAVRGTGNRRGQPT